MPSLRMCGSENLGERTPRGSARRRFLLLLPSLRYLDISSGMSTSLDPWEGVSDGTLTDLSDEEEVLQTRPAPRRSPPKAPKPGMLRPKRAPAEPLASLYAPKRPRTRSSFPLGKEHESNWRLYESVPSHSQQAPQATATSSTPALPIALARPSLRPRTRSSVGIVVEAKQGA